MTKLSRSLRELLSTIKKTWEHGSCAHTKLFWVHLEMVHRCLTTDRCHGACAMQQHSHMLGYPWAAGYTPHTPNGAFGPVLLG